MSSGYSKTRKTQPCSLAAKDRREMNPVSSLKDANWLQASRVKGGRKVLGVKVQDSVAGLRRGEGGQQQAEVVV